MSSIAAPESVPLRTASRGRPGALQRCGGRSCPPGTCDHDETKHGRLSRLASTTRSLRTAPQLVDDVIGSAGQPLPDGPRIFFERRMGHDFGAIRIHADAPAAESASQVDAVAYTVGRHIVFGQGAFRPDAASGREVLAHELVHTIQQAGGSPRDPGGTVRPMGLTLVPTDDPSEQEAARAAHAMVAANPRESVAGAPAAPVHPGRIGPILHRQVAPASGPAGPTPAGQPTAAQQCASVLAATTAEAARQLAAAERSLITFVADQVYPLPAGDPGIPEHRRVAAHLSATFNTTDPIDVEAIAFRIARLERALSGGEVRMTCGTGCGGAVGGNILQGRSPGPFQFTLCGVNASPASLAPTLIHESAHAVLPDVGVTARPTAGRSGVIDRAYDQERLFSHLSPMEAMTNAESYSALVTGLVSGRGPGPAAGSTDTVRGCADRAAIETSLGRGQVAARLVASWLEGAVAMLRGSGSTVVSTISDPFVTDLQAAFPGVTTLADLRKVANDAGVILNNFISSASIRCSPAGANCVSGRLGFVNDVAITTSGLTTLPRILDRSGFINICPDWTSAPDADRAATMYALVATSYLGGAAIQILTPTDAWKLARFALLVTARYLPPPTARSSTEHLLH